MATLPLIRAARLTVPLLAAGLLLAWMPAAQSAGPQPDESIEAEIRGTARIMHPVRKGSPDESELPSSMLLVQSERHGDVLVDMGQAIPSVSHGATVVLRGQLDARTSVLQLEEVLSVEPPSREVTEELEAEAERRAAEQALIEKWWGDVRTHEAFLEENLATAEELIASEKEIGEKGAWEAIADALPPQPPPPTTPLSMLILPTYCSDVATLPTTPTPADLEDVVNAHVSPFFDDASSGIRTFQAVSTPWLDRCEFGIQMNAEQRAVLAGYNPAAYDRVAIVEPGLFGSIFGGGLWAGLAEDIPGRRFYITLGITAPSIWAHELGHLEGLFHANGLHCVDGGTDVTYSLTATCSNGEYDDPSDTMGNSTFTLFSTAQLERLGWFPPGELVTATGGFHEPIILPYSFPASGARAVKIPLASGTYYVERRLAFGSDTDLSATPGLLDGVQLRVIGGQVDSGGFAETIQLNPQLLDGKPATGGDWSDAALPWNTTFLTPEGVKIKAEPVFFGLLARVKVSFPGGNLPPSAPVNVTTVYDPTTNTANLTWDPPLVPGSGGLLFYILEVNPSTGAPPVLTLANSAAISGLPDGLSSVSLRAARLFVGASEPTFSTPQFVWAHPTAPAVAVVEGSLISTTTNVPLTLPWPAPTATDRRVVVRSGSATAGVDFVSGSGTVPFPVGSASETFTFYVTGDLDPEPNETAIVHVGRPVCLSGLYFGTGAFGSYPVECFVWEPVSTVTILDDD